MLTLITLVTLVILLYWLIRNTWLLLSVQPESVWTTETRGEPKVSTERPATKRPIWKPTRTPIQNPMHNPLWNRVSKPVANKSKRTKRPSSKSAAQPTNPKLLLEAVEVLRTLGHKSNEAKRLVAAVGPQTSLTGILDAIYRR